MAGKVTARIPAGMRDILPAQMIKRQYVIDVIRRVFEEFGFEPLQTSAIELTETLTGKYGEDAERLIYKAWYGDTPGDEFSLRYDLSVPLCRVVSMYADQLPQPFKRYQIAPVWRADRPQKGRYREFFQCDADVVGTTSMLADAEVVAVTATVLQRLGFTNFTVSINSRKVLAGIGEYAGVPESLRAGLYRSIDKLDKIGIEGVRRELLMVGVPQDYIPAIQRVARLAIQKKVDPGAIGEALAAPGDGGATGVDPRLAALITPRLKGLAEKVLTEGFNPGELQALTLNMAGELAPELRAFYGEAVDAIPVEVVDRMLDLLQVSGRNDEVLDSLLERLQGIPIAEEGIRDLQEMARYLAALGIPEQAYAINFAMVRGL